MLPYRDQSDWSQETIFKVVSLAGNLYIYIYILQGRFKSLIERPPYLALQGQSLSRIAQE